MRVNAIQDLHCWFSIQVCNVLTVLRRSNEKTHTHTTHRVEFPQNSIKQEHWQTLSCRNLSFQCCISSVHGYLAQHRQRLSYRKLSHQCCTYSVHGRLLQQTKAFPVLYWGEEKLHRFSCRMLDLQCWFLMCMCSWKQEHAELYFQCRSSITRAVFPLIFCAATRARIPGFLKTGFIEHTCTLVSLKKTHTEFLKQSIGSPMLVPCCVFPAYFWFIPSVFFFAPSTYLSHNAFLSTMLFCQPPTSLIFLFSLYCFVQLSDADKLRCIWVALQHPY